MHNLQGDIIGILDKTGTSVVEYGYDSWGKPTGMTGSLAGTLGYVNPFRYRGYVWDEETGLYYLRNRYYDPEWQRFVNADTVLGETGALLSHNAFAYCFNKPVNTSDQSGHWPKWITDSVNWVAGAAIDVADWTKQAAIDVADWTVQAASDTGDFLHRGLTAYGNAIQLNAMCQREMYKDISAWVSRVSTDVRKLAQTTGGQILTNLATGVFQTAMSVKAGTTAALVSAVPPPAAAITVPMATGFAVKASYHYAKAVQSFNKVLRLIFGGKK